MQRIVLVLCLFLTCLCPGIFGQGSARIAIYVGPQVRDGFVDADVGVLDSIKDIQDELKKSPRFTVAPTLRSAPPSCSSCSVGG